MQFINIDGEWVNRTDGPYVSSDLDRWRRKPKLIPVDLSVLIESGIDCEFSNETPEFRYSIGKLSAINRVDEYLMSDNSGGLKPFDKCRPRLNHIHAWQGGKCPLPKGLKIHIYYREKGNTLIHDYKVENRWEWRLSDKDSDIIHFEILGLADGYCWPWEV